MDELSSARGASNATGFPQPPRDQAPSAAPNAAPIARGRRCANRGTPNPRPQRYRAFLSYSHADRKVAAWLHHKLENYRVPRALVRYPTPFGPAPAKLGRVFRDDAEFAASENLGAAIEEALAESGALIVLCSPDAARSQWVNAEIKRFTDIRPGGKVLALAVAGNMGNEIMPPALLQQQRRDQALGSEPFVPDLRQGHSTALTRLTAALLGLRFDDLYRRERRRQPHSPLQHCGRRGGITADRRLCHGLDHLHVTLASHRGRGRLRSQSGALRPRRRPGAVRAAESPARSSMCSGQRMLKRNCGAPGYIRSERRRASRTSKRPDSRSSKTGSW